jgi:hypothetical protein
MQVPHNQFASHMQPDLPNVLATWDLLTTGTNGIAAANNGANNYYNARGCNPHPLNVTVTVTVTC